MGASFPIDEDVTAIIDISPESQPKLFEALRETFYNTVTDADMQALRGMLDVLRFAVFTRLRDD